MAGALLFDLDGTLLHSDPVHLSVFRDLFAEYGMTLRDEDYGPHILGQTNEQIFGHFTPAEDWRALSEDKEARFRARLADEAVIAPGLLAFLNRAEAAGHPMAVVTNAPRENAEAMLAAIGQRDRFGVVIASGEAPRGKPAPDPYLAALDALGADAADALAFEDSVPGLTAAVAAGLTVVGMRSSLDEATLKAAGAALTIEDFNDPALGPLLDRLTGAAA